MDLLTFRETRTATKRGRNQMRVAFGIGAVAALGYNGSKLIDPSVATLGQWWWVYGFGAILSVRMALWLFLTIEGGRE